MSMHMRKNAHVVYYLNYMYERWNAKMLWKIRMSVQCVEMMK